MRRWDRSSRVLLFWDIHFAANLLGQGTFIIHKESSCYIFLLPGKVGLATFKMLPVSDSDVPLHDTFVLSITRKASVLPEQGAGLKLHSRRIDVLLSLYEVSLERTGG